MKIYGSKTDNHWAVQPRAGLFYGWMKIVEQSSCQ